MEVNNEGVEKSFVDYFKSDKRYFFITGLIGFIFSSLGSVLVDYLSSYLEESALPQIEGKWHVIMSPCEDLSVVQCGEKYSGQAIVSYDEKQNAFKIRGCSGSKDRKDFHITYNTFKSWHTQNQFYFLYENSQDERGVIYGQIDSKTPNSFTLYYVDFPTTDNNQDPIGVLNFSKRVRNSDDTFSACVMD